MADERKIHSGVRHQGQVYTDTDKLQEVLTPEMTERLEKSGAISGFSEHAEKAEAKAKKAAPAKDEDGKEGKGKK